MDTSIIIPAFNEEKRIPNTLNAIRSYPLPGEIELIVVDDGSEDLTSSIAGIWADKVVCLERNHGKGFAMKMGLQVAAGNRILFLDADLEDSAAMAWRLLVAMDETDADMVVAHFPPQGKGGFGLAKRWAQKELERRMGRRIGSPLSGQRLLNRKAVKSIENWDCGFGIEVSMLLDIHKAGLKVIEVSIPFSHRETKKDIRGFLHRGKQFFQMRKTVKQWGKECT